MGGGNAGFGAAVVEVAKRGGHDILRPRHPDNPLRTSFTGTPAYAPDPRWVREGRFVPYDAPRPVTVGAAVEGLEHVYDSPGSWSSTWTARRTASRSSTAHGRAP